VEEQQFRQDLYYRLSVVQIRLPNLRDREGDIPLLARYFLWQAGCVDPDAVITPEVLRLFSSRKWRGNVRELRNVIERATVLSDGGDFSISDEPASLPAPSLPPAAGVPGEAGSQDHQRPWVISPTVFEQPYKTAKDEVLRQFELLYLQRQVERHGDNISRIAAEAGVDRQLVRKLLRRHGLRSE
jgi:DNA-binding NtrC family response regulator